MPFSHPSALTPGIVNEGARMNRQPLTPTENDG